MIYYFLPVRGIYGGIKVGYQFTALLNSLGFRAVTVSPDGTAPQWFNLSVAVVAERDVLDGIKRSDSIIFSLPHDYERLKKTPAKLIFHYQETDPLIHPILRDMDVIILTCWDQATQYVREEFSREPVEVGIAISDCFYICGEKKHEQTVAFMPRRGGEIIQSCRATCCALDFQPIDGLHEEKVSRILKAASMFLATAKNEWFGLSALEAMAAGCLVLSVPVLGGMEYLRHGENCIIAEPDTMAECLQWLMKSNYASLRTQLRYNALHTAYRYRLSLQQRRLRHVLKNGLNLLC